MVQTNSVIRMQELDAVEDKEPAALDDSKAEVSHESHGHETAQWRGFEPLNTDEHPNP